MKYLKLLSVSLIFVFLFSACTENNANTPPPVSGETVAEDTLFKIFKESEIKYNYSIFDKTGNTLFNSTIPRQPEISVIDSKIVKVAVKAGEGVSSVTTFYYDTEQNICSAKFISVLADTDTKVVFSDGKRIMVQDIFNRAAYYKVISDFDPPLSDISAPFISADFSENGESVSITYISDKNSEAIKIFELN